MLGEIPQHTALTPVSGVCWVTAAVGAVLGALCCVCVFAVAWYLPNPPYASIRFSLLIPHLRRTKKKHRWVVWQNMVEFGDLYLSAFIDRSIASLTRCFARGDA